MDCFRCPKRAVRRVANLDEAKWNDLKSTEKRRFFDCFADNSPPLVFGYAAFRREQLQSIAQYHLLYDDVQFPPAWDIALKAFAYTEILMELSDQDEPLVFYPDQFASRPQWEALEETIESHLPRVAAETKSSKQVRGIQAADCLAGGIREQENGGEPWLDYLDPSAVTNCNYWALTQLEHRLSEV
jgi:hypothetical protein